MTHSTPGASRTLEGVSQPALNPYRDHVKGPHVVLSVAVINSSADPGFKLPSCHGTTSDEMIVPADWHRSVVKLRGRLLLKQVFDN